MIVWKNMRIAECFVSILMVGFVLSAVGCADGDDKPNAGGNGNSQSSEDSRACYSETNKVCNFFNENNAGTTEEIQAHCIETGNTVLDACPEEDFISSCDLSNGMKQYYYQGFTNGTPDEDNCTTAAGVYSDVYSPTL